MNVYGVEIFTTGFRHGSRIIADEIETVLAAEKVRNRHGALPVKVQHQPVQEGCYPFGHVENLRRSGDVVIGDLICVPDHLLERYRFVSAESRVPIEIDGYKFKRCLTAVGLTDRPGAWGLADVFGNRTNELVMRPTGEYGFESFKIEDEEALIACETLLDNEPGDEWELEAEAGGCGLLSIGLCAHKADGTMVETFYRFASCEMNGETRRLYGRGLLRDDFPMIAAAFEARTKERLEIPWMSIKRVSR